MYQRINLDRIEATTKSIFWKHVQIYLNMSLVVVVTFLKYWSSYYEYLIHYQLEWRFLCSLNGHISPPPQIMMTTVLVIIFWAHSPISFKTHCFLISKILENGTTPTTYHSNIFRCPIKINNQIRHIYTMWACCGPFLIQPQQPRMFVNLEVPT